MLSGFSVVRLFAPIKTVACQAPLPMGFPGKDTVVVCQALLQGIFLTEGSNLNLMSPELACGFFTSSTTLALYFLS